MPPLSGREQRILTEIEDRLARAEPRLARALAAGRASRGRHAAGVLAVLLGPLLCGFGLLALGIRYHDVALITIGIPLAQFSPVAAGYLLLTRRRR
jgi:hypothetical protein